MADTPTAEHTAQLERDIKRHVNPSFRRLQKNLRVAQYGVITIVGGGNGDTITLGKIGVAGVVHPAHCRIVGLSGSVGGTVKIQKLPAAGGAAEDLSALATLATDGVEVPFLRAAGALKSFGADDVLLLNIVSGTNVEPGDTIEFVLAYSSEEAP